MSKDNTKQVEDILGGIDLEKAQAIVEAATESLAQCIDLMDDDGVPAYPASYWLKIIQAAKIVGAEEEREQLQSRLEMPIEETGLFKAIETSLSISTNARNTAIVSRQYLEDIINNEDDTSN